MTHRRIMTTPAFKLNTKKHFVTGILKGQEIDESLVYYRTKEDMTILAKQLLERGVHKQVFSTGDTIYTFVEVEDNEGRIVYAGTQCVPKE